VAATLDFASERRALRRRELRLMFALSVAFHGSLLALLVTSPVSFTREPASRLPAVITVDLVAAPAPAAKPKQAAVPIPKPAPKPKPIVKKTVLPKQTTRDPERRAPEPKPAVQEDYTDVLAQLRAEKGEAAPERSATVTAAAELAKAPPESAGVGRPISPEVVGWMRRTKAKIKRNWVLPPGFRTQALETHVLVDIDASGRVRGEPRVTRPSGNPWYDQGVVSAIRKSSPLPAPPEADRWPFVFMPEDSF